ncbi:MAG: hypothetical protein WDN75_15255 [Bacteroidota bacterium]
MNGLHHIHIWAISSTENAMTAHLVLDRDVTLEQEQHIKHELRHELEHQNIQHITLENGEGETKRVRRKPVDAN